MEAFFGFSELEQAFSSVPISDKHPADLLRLGKTKQASVRRFSAGMRRRRSETRDANQAIVLVQYLYPTIGFRDLFHWPPCDNTQAGPERVIS